ncbi:MAG: isoprenyl transferase [Elusimicrobia bacterium]|nr:isoprenyl transferase [Elusimicrobiota bacterium]MBK7545164.1 isoprenyl transferase [Elusimicrobiota bacterium]MBK7574685.1 isoprenyl transferase [Elusimicrobiota bacterium]MBK7688741.1 isoprenyl transferase [Elusimicrobiota bacterium]MBK8126830.1 isoprenyl transferase [Elusimicrobiota bacterium]
MPSLLNRRPPVVSQRRVDVPVLDPARVPAHVAVIMDGNGRWAQRRGKPRLWGHRAGAESVRAVVRAAGDAGVKVLTLYAFSTENWSRSAGEVNGLMALLVGTLRREIRRLDENNVRLRAIGRLDGLPAAVRAGLKKAVAVLEDNTGLVLTLALNYGGRQEIVDAAQRVTAAGEAITEESLARRLYTAGLPDPDLMIRTSGEYRLSNFLLWQSAYTELYVTPVLWPDFREGEFYEALLDYQKRERRFGGVQ